MKDETAPEGARSARASSAIAEWRGSVSAQSERTEAAVSSLTSGRPEAATGARSADYERLAQRREPS
jgi:hypothetical protein